MALVLHRHLQARLRAGKRSESPERVLQQLRRIQAHEVTVDGATHHTTIAIRAEHRVLCEQLELSLPDAQALPPPRTRPLRRHPPPHGDPLPPACSVKIKTAPRHISHLQHWTTNSGRPGLPPLRSPPR